MTTEYVFKTARCGACGTLVLTELMMRAREGMLVQMPDKSYQVGCSTACVIELMKAKHNE